MSLQIRIKKLKPNFVTPNKAYHDDAGIDIFAGGISEEVIVPPRSQRLIPMGFAMALPTGYCAVIKDRSGLAVRNGIHTRAGVIDAQYRGEVNVLMVNGFDEPFVVRPGDKIAQMMIVPVPGVQIIEVDDLDDTQRGEAGFGSTGV